MELEKQVCSLELAKRLKELGVKQDSAFYWSEEYYSHFRPERIGRIILEREAQEKVPGGDWRCFSAFTVAELGEMLPPYTKSYRYYGGFDCDLENKPPKRADIEADARAKMLIFLKEKE